MDLHGKTVLVTGGARRIGAAIARSAAAGGASVIVHYRSSKAEAEALAEVLRAARVNAWALQADLAEPGAAEDLFDRALALASGRIDAVVNSASDYPASANATLAEEELFPEIRLHAYAPLVLARRLAALPPSPGAPRCIINLLDARVTMADSGHAAYHLSKRMLLTLTRMLAVELAPAVRVNAVAPGAVLQPDGAPASELERLAQFNPLRAHGSPEGVAECVRFLLASDFVTGQVLFYDGGYHLKAATYG